MILGGLEILAKGENISALRGEVLHRREDFVFFFAKTQHQACFCGDVGVSCFGAAEKFERTLVERAFAYLAIEARDGFGVVVQNIRLDGEN